MGERSACCSLIDYANRFVVIHAEAPDWPARPPVDIGKHKEALKSGETDNFETIDSGIINTGPFT